MEDKMMPGTRDIKIGDLVPLREREIDLNKNKGFAKLLATIRAVGLLNPISVYRENGEYRILDGFLRYKGCERLGIDMVPCLVYSDKEAYTFNRMVNHLSPVQEMRMLQRSLKRSAKRKSQRCSVTSRSSIGWDHLISSNCIHSLSRRWTRN